jgi:5'-3' exonuclease
MQVLLKENEIKNYFGRKVAIDASMSLYQFLIAVRGDGGAQLTSEDGETTSHLMGFFYRTIRLVATSHLKGFFQGWLSDPFLRRVGWVCCLNALYPK